MSNEENVSTVASDRHWTHTAEREKASRRPERARPGRRPPGRPVWGSPPCWRWRVGRSRWGWWPGRLVIRAVIRELRVGELEIGHPRVGRLEVTETG